jgi:hypothetical protein
MNAGRSANAYMEGRASGDVCSGGGATSGSYHDSLRAVSPTLTNAWCNAHDLDLSQFDPAHLPAYSAVYPKNTSNWHDNSISSGDTWLKDHLSPLLNSPAYAAGDVAVVFHTDEDTPVVNGDPGRVAFLDHASDRRRDGPTRARRLAPCAVAARPVRGWCRINDHKLYNWFFNIVEHCDKLLHFVVDHHHEYKHHDAPSGRVR